MFNFMKKNTQTTQMEPKSFRLILIGDCAVGKTALLKYFVESKCPNEVPLGYNYYTNLIQVDDGTMVKLQLQDTVGNIYAFFKYL